MHALDVRDAFGESDPEISVRNGADFVDFDGDPLRLTRGHSGATALKRDITVVTCVVGVWDALSKHINRSATV
jgi:hypothetical protein